MLLGQLAQLGLLGRGEHLTLGLGAYRLDDLHLDIRDQRTELEHDLILHQRDVLLGRGSRLRLRWGTLTVEEVDLP